MHKIMYYLQNNFLTVAAFPLIIYVRINKNKIFYKEFLNVIEPLEKNFFILYFIDLI